jgi:hypothetical protein
MPNKPEISIGLGLALAVAVVAIYDHMLPTVAETRVNQAGDRDLAAAERTATWTASVLVGAVSLLAKDATAFVIGGSVIVAHAWTHRHANHYDPEQGKISVPVTSIAPVDMSFQPTAN